MPNTFNAALLFLVQTLFDLYLIILIVRVILVWIGSNYFNPLVQFVIKLTDAIVKPVRAVIPNIGRIETATVLWVFGIEVTKFFLIAMLSYGYPNIGGIIILALGDILKLLIQTFFYAILFQAIMTWIQPRSPLNYVLFQFTSPIMRPIQRVIPPIGGIDISPIPAMIILQLLSIMLVQPLMGVGVNMAFS